MPSTSEKQRRTACAVLAVREGKASAKKFPHLAGVMRGMSIEDLRHYCTEKVKK